MEAFSFEPYKNSKMEILNKNKSDEIHRFIAIG
jgi:hypothetical protein